MRPISLTSFATFVAIALALTLSACGNKTSTIHHAETEGVYVNVGPLKYQVQISRALNPGAISEDRTFLSDVDPADATLGPDEIWFAVFVRVENETDQPQAPAPVYEITDQQGNTFEPVKIGDLNPFHYDMTPIRPGGFAPGPDTIARQDGSVGGMIQLFKLKHETLDNRPLELKIRSVSPEDESTVSIDV
ncbi:MAG: hypothetical protein JWM73_131 [Solirubrobacterales bacterium]|jgi:hypothetical protein|nr:hypothetical protein [Solirubrobacterales bacterium]